MNNKQALATVLADLFGPILVLDENEGIESEEVEVQIRRLRTMKDGTKTCELYSYHSETSFPTSINLPNSLLDLLNDRGK